MTALEQLIELSANVGANPLLVQAAGGNTSLKENGTMWIKASGTWLRDAKTANIFVPVDHKALMSALDRKDPACESCVDFVRSELNKIGLRPSIETAVHALMPQDVVLHVHCVNTISWAIRKNAEEILAHELAGFNWVFIPYARPGLPLAEAISRRLQPDTEVLVLGNHGVVVAADTVSNARVLLDRVVAKLSVTPRPTKTPDYQALKNICAGTDYSPASSDGIHALATDSAVLDRVRTQVLYPDHVVFLGVGVATDLQSNAPLVALKDLGVVIHRTARAAVEPMGRCLADVMRRVDPNQEVVGLNTADIGRLTNWDAEKYRQDRCK